MNKVRQSGSIRIYAFLFLVMLSMPVVASGVSTAQCSASITIRDTYVSGANVKTAKKTLTHSLQLKISSGRIIGFQYQSINTNTANDCGIQADRGDGRSKWVDQGPITFVTVPDPDVGDQVRVELRKIHNRYRLNLLETGADTCGESGALVGFAEIIPHHKRCELQEKVSSGGGDGAESDAVFKLLPRGSKFDPDIYDNYFSADLSGNGRNDVVGLFSPPKGLIIALQSAKRQFHPALIYENSMLKLNGVLAANKGRHGSGRIELSQSFSKWHWYGELSVVNGAVRVTHETNVDAVNPEKWVFRDFERASGKQRNGPNSKQVKFHMLVATPQLKPLTLDVGTDSKLWASATKMTVDHRNYAYFHPSRWHGSKDLSFSAQSQWSTKALFLRIKVHDDKVVQPFDGDKMLNGDHLELWVGRNQPKQFAISALAQLGDAQAIRQWYPKSDIGRVPGAKAVGRRTTYGYVVEVKLPLAALGIKAPSTGVVFTRHTNPVPFTIVVSDSDNAKSPRQDKAMASSQLTWGRPGTFGELYLVHQSSLPLFEVKN